MSRHRALWAVVAVLVIASASPLLAARAAPSTCTFLGNNSPTTGISDDGRALYDHGVEGVRCYFGVNGRDAILVTYTTPRKLLFKFNPDAPAFVQSGLGVANFTAVVDLFGINYYAPYRDMIPGNTSRVQMDLEFYVGNITYELDYQNLAVMRLKDRTDTWLITSDPNDICPAWISGEPPRVQDCMEWLQFVPSSEADLNVIRRKSQTKFGKVNMPIRFEMKMK